MDRDERVRSNRGLCQSCQAYVELSSYVELSVCRAVLKECGICSCIAAVTFIQSMLDGGLSRKSGQMKMKALSVK